jgi:mono/diheme cytochrome c family protein
VMATGLSARPRPGVLETRLARTVRSLAVPRAAKSRPNPVPDSRETLESGMRHFADHCAMCHANDGSGSAEMGQHLFPPPPDMRAAPTQALTDGELFYVIENGVRFTGMPAFATGDAEGEQASWELVRFIRRLPTLSADDVARMEKMNPRSPDEIRQEIEDEQFLQGGSVAPAQGSESGHKGAH